MTPPHVLVGQLPEGWSQERLADVCGVQAGPGGTVIASAKQRTEGVPVVRPADIRDLAVGGPVMARVPDEIAHRMPRYRLKAGDVLCTRTGEPGRAGLVDTAHEGWLYSTSLLRLRPHDGLLSAHLVSYLALPAVQGWILSRATGSTAIRSISMKSLGDLPVLLPPLSVQARIATVLSALQEKARAHAEISRSTAELRDTLAQLLLTGTMAVPPQVSECGSPADG